MTIYEFSEEMMLAHNILAEARLAFGNVLEESSRKQGLTERHRSKWIAECQRISSVSPVMERVTDTTTGLDGPIVEISDMEWNDFIKYAKDHGIKTFGKKREEIEKELSIEV